MNWPRQLEFTGQVAGEATGEPVRVYPLSARAALTERNDPGFAAFHADFTSYLDRERSADLQLSAVAQARRLASSLRDEVALARRAAELRSGDAAGQVEAFAARLAAVAARGRDAADLVRADSARLLAELNQAAQRAARDRTRQVGDELTALLDGPLRSAGAAEIERSGRARLAELAVAAAESWRQRQAARLEDGLARLDARMIEDLRAELAAVRAAAADLLGLALTMPGGAERLAPDLRFFYLVEENAGQTELLAGAIRRHLPGEAGRRRARAYLRREVAELVPRLIGRARADLQYRLAEATRQLVRATAARYAEGTGRLENALQRRHRPLGDHGRADRAAGPRTGRPPAGPRPHRRATGRRRPGAAAALRGARPRRGRGSRYPPRSGRLVTASGGSAGPATCSARAWAWAVPYDGASGTATRWWIPPTLGACSMRASSLACWPMGSCSARMRRQDYGGRCASPARGQPEAWPAGQPGPPDHGPAARPAPPGWGDGRPDGERAGRAGGGRRGAGRARGAARPAGRLAGRVPTRRGGSHRHGGPALAVPGYRPAPAAAAGWLTEPEGFSLPSKHTTLAALTAGALAGQGTSGSGPRRAAPLLAAAGVGAGRVYLGVHWPTDVLAGWLFAEGWLRLARWARPADDTARS